MHSSDQSELERIARHLTDIQSHFPTVEILPLEPHQQSLVLAQQREIDAAIGQVRLLLCRKAALPEMLLPAIVTVEVGRILYHLLYASRRQVYLSLERQRILQAFLEPLWRGESRLRTVAEIAAEAHVAQCTIRPYAADLRRCLACSGYTFDVRRAREGTLSYRMLFSPVTERESGDTGGGNGRPLSSSPDALGD